MKRRSKFLRHINANRRIYTWIAIFMIFFLGSSRRMPFLVSFLVSSVTVAPMVILAALLQNVLIPRFLQKSRTWYYLNSFIAILVISMCVVAIETRLYGYLYYNNLVILPEEIVEQIAYVETNMVNVGKNILYAKYFILLSVNFAVVTISHMLDEAKRIEQATREQRMSQELKYLRAQINPHFLFNALNCIYSLTLTQDEKAPDSVMKLSEMLRFVIDDCRADKVPITKEVAYISNYIDFQKIRMENDPNLTFVYKIKNNNFEIPPMVFQPMVENCFKHSRIIDDNTAFIRISLVQDGNTVVFETENSKHVNPFGQEDNERTGIGINNVRQRLNLIFGEDYSFEISETETTYKTKLIINDDEV